MSFGAFQAYIDSYESSGLGEGERPPEALISQFAGVATVFASDAQRVAETLGRLGLRPDFVSSDLREAPPVAPRAPLRLPAIVWLGLARARGEFSPRFAKARDDLRRRAAVCADQLDGASQLGPAALVGHGWFNRYVAAALTAQGWRKADGPGFARPWGYLRLERHAG